MEWRTVVLILTAAVPLASAATHSYQYFYTAVTSETNFPQFTIVGLVDGGQIVYYDSNIKKCIPKAQWMENFNVEDYWNRQTQIMQGAQESFKANLDVAMQRFNQTKGVHTVQFMYGCELHDDGTKRGHMQHGYDGEDFLVLDLNTESFIAPVSQAVLTKQKWDRAGSGRHHRQYLENECIEWLQKYVGHGKDRLERKVRPEVDLFSSDSSSPVVCHATGFFPKAVMISWQKNGEDLNEDVELRETLPNQDGTFQKRSILTLSPEELKNNEYTCVVQHSSMEKERVLKVSDRRVLSGAGGVVVIVGAVVAVLLVLIALLGVQTWKKKSDFKPVSGSETSSGSKNFSDSKPVSGSESVPGSTDSLSSVSSSDSASSTAKLLPPK